MYQYFFLKFFLKNDTFKKIFINQTIIKVTIIFFIKNIFYVIFYLNLDIMVRAKNISKVKNLVLDFLSHF